MAVALRTYLLLLRQAVLHPFHGQVLPPFFTALSAFLTLICNGLEGRFLSLRLRFRFGFVKQPQLQLLISRVGPLTGGGIQPLLLEAKPSYQATFSCSSCTRCSKETHRALRDSMSSVEEVGMVFMEDTFDTRMPTSFFGVSE